MKSRRPRHGRRRHRGRPPRGRAAETGAEKARLATADIVAEARLRIGEQAPPPDAAADEHDH